MLRPVPPTFHLAARKLMRRKGVVGVFWGFHDPRRRGPRRLRVHVEHKHALDELHPTRVIDRRIEGLRTCVVQVGSPCGHVLTCKDVVRTDDGRRVSTMTALIREEDDWLALLSGHGTLPIEDGAFDTDYTADGDGEPLDLEDVSSGSTFDGRLVRGRMTATQDWGVARVDVPDKDIDLVVPVTGTYRPAIRVAAFSGSEGVRHYSALDRRTKRGTVVGYGQVRLKMFDGKSYLYTRAIEVHGTSGAFSRDGDSGSVVADGADRVIGVVVGAADPPSRSSYVLPFASPNGTVLAELERFFS